MKNNLFVLVTLLMSMIFVSCDNNNPSYGGTLVGSWKAAVMSNCVIYDRFQADHTLIHIEVWDGEDIDKDVYTWQIEGDKLLTTDEKGRVETCTYSIKGDKLVRTEGLSVTYTRCPDSEMDYYIKMTENDKPDEPEPYNPPDPVDPPSDCNNIQASYLPVGASGLGEMKEQLVSGTKSWFYDEKYGARVSKSNTEAWLYTPTYDMSVMASVQVSFEHAINYAGDMQTQQTMWVTDNFSGDVTTTNWQQVPIPNYPSGDNWTFVSNTVNIPIQYVGEKTVVAFKYTSGGAGSTATWEIKNLVVNAICANN